MSALRGQNGLPPLHFGDLTVLMSGDGPVPDVSSLIQESARSSAPTPDWPMA